MVFTTPPIKMQVPDYIMKAIYAHYKRIAQNATCPAQDIRTRNAFRLSKADLRKLENLIEANANNNEVKPKCGKV